MHKIIELIVLAFISVAIIELINKIRRCYRE